MLHLIYFVDNEPNELLTLLMDKKFSGTRQGQTRLSSSSILFIEHDSHLGTVIKYLKNGISLTADSESKDDLSVLNNPSFCCFISIFYRSYVFVLLKIVYVSFDCLYLVLKVTLNYISKY